MSEYTPAGKLVYLAAGGSVSNDGKTQARVYGNGVPAIEVQHGWVVSPPEFALLYAPLQVRAAMWTPCLLLDPMLKPFPEGRESTALAQSPLCDVLSTAGFVPGRDSKFARPQMVASAALRSSASVSLLECIKEQHEDRAEDFVRSA